MRWSRSPAGLAVVLVAVVLVLALGVLAPGAQASVSGPAPGQPEPPPPATEPIGGYHVSGNQIIGPSGQPVTFKGVNAWSFGLQGGTSPMPPTIAGMDEQIGVMRAWGFNLVRLYLYDNYWLNPTCPPPSSAGWPGNYQTWVQDAVDQITADGMVAELTLWGAEGQGAGTPCSDLTDLWPNMADYPYSLQMWSQVAQMFEGNPLVAFETFNEPHIAAVTPSGASEDDVWLNGGGYDPVTQVETAGMQQIYGAIRSAGATNLVFVTGETLGPNYEPSGDTAYDSLKVVPRDPVQGYNVVYATHIYDGNFNSACGDEMLPTPPLSAAESEDQAAILPTAALYPVVIDEFGSACTDGSLAEENNADVVSWADHYGLGYAVFAWDVWYNPGWGILDGFTTYGPSPDGIPVYDDLRNQPCTDVCPGPVFANPPRPQDYEPAATSVANPTVSISPTTAAGASGVDYTVHFDTSQEGLLASGGWVRLQAPAGTSFYDTSTPVVIDVTSGAQVQATCCSQVGDAGYQTLDGIPDDAQLGAASNEITIPLAGTVSPGDELEVLLDGVTNQSSGPLSLQVSTSTDRAPVATNSISVTSAQPVSGPSESLSSYAASATGVTWTTTFTTSSTGAMSGLWPGGTITLTAPAGTGFEGSPGYASLYDLTTGQPVAGGYLTQSGSSFTFGLRSATAAGDTLQLVVGNVTNPPAGTYTASVNTSSDSPGTSPSFTVS